MTVELTPEVSGRLTSEHFAWLTTVAKSGIPVPKLIWFLYSGTPQGADLYLFTVPGSAKIAHIRRHPQVSLHLDSDGNGGGVVVVGGTATVDAEGLDPRTDEPYWAKYGESAKKFGMADAMSAYNTRIKITAEKVWTTPTEG